ncbi:hypothetical protein BDZ45DRAFT_744619 [Acephala macrosclerotiorum]|nr:hypothetical protein BDZ45DRAFT_744619 [Acephala macrosclerotiorum]
MENGVPVIKLFLEYCPGGDMLKMMESNRILNSGAKAERPKNPFLEADIWTVFNCLASGLSVMDRGTEDEFAPAWNRDAEIAHNDLELDNVFLGYRDPDHERYPVLEIADFGVAREELKVQKDQYGAEPRKRGTPNVKPPESDNQGHPLLHLRKGTCSNVYQVGCIIHCLMQRQSKMFGAILRGGAAVIKDSERGEVRQGLEAAGFYAKKTNAFKDNLGWVSRIPMNDYGRIWAEPPVLVDIKGVVIPQRQPNVRTQEQTSDGGIIWTLTALIIIIGYISYMCIYVIKIDMLW